MKASNLSVSRAAASSGSVAVPISDAASQPDAGPAPDNSLWSKFQDIITAGAQAKPASAAPQSDQSTSSWFFDPSPPQSPVSAQVSTGVPLSATVCAPGDINCDNVSNYAYKTGQYTGDWKPAVLDGKMKFRNERTGEWSDTYPGLNGLRGLGAPELIRNGPVPVYQTPSNYGRMAMLGGGLLALGLLGYALYKRR